MTGRPVTAPDGATPASAIEARLEPDAIGVAQDTIIGMANAGPAASVALTLAALAAAAAYGSGPVIVLCGAAMLVIANAYRRLNLWNANCGASFEWVGRAISPYLGFLTGWLILAANLVGNVAAVIVLAPSVLAIFGANATSRWPNIAIATGLIVVITAITVAGIRLTARTQVGMAVVEYGIVLGFAVVAFVAVLSHRHGTFPVTRGWFSLSGIGGKGSLASGLLLVVFMYTGWDATVYVNEEVKHRRVNPGKAAVYAVALLGVFYTVSVVGLQGAVSPAKLEANSSSPLVYIAQALAGSGWAKVMALALALSVIGGVGTGIVVLSRMTYGMASYRALPPALGNVSRRFATPAIASVIAGVILIGATWAYLLSSSIANVFAQVLSTTGVLFAAFYILTALAAVVYYRHRIRSNLWDALLVGVFPLAGAVFLGWVVVKSLQAAPASQIWSLDGIIGAGVVLMFVARFALRSSFFQTPRESAPLLPARDAASRPGMPAAAPLAFIALTGQPRLSETALAPTCHDKGAGPFAASRPGCHGPAESCAWQRPCRRPAHPKVRFGFRNIHWALSALASAPKPGEPGLGLRQDRRTPSWRVLRADCHGVERLDRREDGGDIISIAEPQFGRTDFAGRIVTLAARHANAEKSRTVEMQTYRGVSMTWRNNAHHGPLPAFWATRGVRYSNQAYARTLRLSGTFTSVSPPR